MIIAIDGPSGAGKSSLGKLLAGKFDLLYLDTGAMYRAVALSALRQNIDLSDHALLTEAAKKAEIKLTGKPDDLRVFLNGDDVTAEIRTQETAQAASKASTVSGVRQLMVELQRKIGLEHSNGCVLEGRDIGTVVFPNADIKFFLTALPEARARRRFEEDKARGRVTTYEKTLAEITERDERDVSRIDSPLSIGEDAVVIDTSELELKEVFEIMLSKIAERQNADA